MATLPPLTGVPPSAAAGATFAATTDPKQLQRFLDNATAGTQLRFRVDSDAGRVVVQVLDSQSGEVLRQIPREEAVKLARSALDEPVPR